MSTTLTQVAESIGSISLKPNGAATSHDAKSPDYKYKRFLPTYGDTDLKLPPLEPFEHHDPGHAALKDADPQSFLKSATVKKLTPKFGAEILDGVDLTALSAKERSQLALYVAQKGVVVLRKQQKFIDADPNWQINDWGKTYGRIHTHPTSGQPADFPELHLVYRDEDAATDDSVSFEKLNRLTLHSDVTYEAQPPGLTTLFLYTSPEEGGDTLFIDQREAYNRLSPSFREYLETLKVVHSGFEQYDRAVQAHGVGSIKRLPVKSEHPLIRRHPVTGEKALFVQPGFSRYIVGLKKEESDAILGLLYTHLKEGHDFQARARWGAGTVVLWDNRITAHSAIVDFVGTGGIRHGARITAQAERPFL